MRHLPIRSWLAPLALALAACTPLPSSALSEHGSERESGGTIPEPQPEGVKQGSCDAPKVPLGTLPSGICMASDPSFYWDGSRCVQMPFNRCFVGNLVDKYPRVFPTMNDCEAIHAHCH